MEKLKGWRDLGVVSTIYEEEEKFSDSSSVSSSISPPSTPLLQSRIEAWTMAKGCQPDVLISVRGLTFHLHKEPLSARSGYLRRKLKETSKIILSPPLNISVETFTLIADFCYSPHLIITPFNVVALKVATELLEMTECTKGFPTDDNLGHRTDLYLRRYIGTNRDYTLVIFKSCLLLLPEAETIASLVSRCIESLISSDDGIMSCIEDIKTLQPKNFQIVAESLSGLLMESHDILYRTINVYLKENGEKMGEDEKTKLCNCIDCTRLSPQLLIHAVQNPKMPLRFIIQAMFVDQLHTRHSIFSNRRQNRSTLGGILQRDAALRHTSQLQASMDVTYSRIKSLEQELDGMRKILNENQSGRSVSSRFEYGKKVEKDQRGSVSSSSFSRFEYGKKVEKDQRGSVSSSSLGRVLRKEEFGADSCSQGSCDAINHDKSFRRKLVEKVRSAFSTKKNSDKT